MTRLADFKNQYHITAVLRAMVVKDDPVSSIVFVGGDESERQEVAYAFLKALRCESPIKGDSCGACSSCSTFYHFSNSSYGNKPATKWMVYFFTNDKEIYWLGDHSVKILSVGLLSELDPDTVRRATVFEFNAPPKRSEHYDIAAQLIKLCVEVDVKSVLEQVPVYAIVDALIEVLLEVQQLKLGVEVEYASETVRKLAIVMNPSKVVPSIRLLWDFKNHSEKNNKLILTFLADSISPIEYYEFKAGSSDEPISSMEVTQNPQSLTLDEMVEIASS